EGLGSGQMGIETVRKPLAHGTMTATFDATPLIQARRAFKVSVAITVGASIFATILLVLYIPRITRPVEEMLTSAGEIRTRSPDDDEQQFLIDTFRDSISRLKVQEEELHRLHQAERTRADELERVTAALTRSIASGYISLDARGCIVEMNAAAREILCLTAEETRGETIEQALGDGEFATLLRTSIEEQTPINRRELRIPLAQGERIIGITTVPLLGVNLGFLGMLVLFTDLTPVRRLEDRLRELQNLADLGELSAGIAHEFRNSLSAILGSLRLTRDKPLHEVQRLVEDAQREARSLAEAVDGLLVFAKPMTLEADRLDLAELAGDVVARLSPHASPAVIEYSASSAIINGDAHLLERAIDNLLRNAIESVRQKGAGSVRVTVSSDPQPLLRIEDEGIGVDPAAVARLFLPFQSDSPGGYGMGLPLVKKIILLHEGSVELTGVPGEGAQVTVRLPAA